MYNFEGIEKNLQKKTFAREEKAKEVAGLTPELGDKLSELSTRFQAYYEVYEKEQDGVKKSEWMEKIVSVNGETLKIKEQMSWEKSFDKAIAVMDILLVEGSASLTKDNFCGDDAEVVWNDFFTQKSNIKSTELPKK